MFERSIVSRQMSKMSEYMILARKKKEELMRIINWNVTIITTPGDERYENAMFEQGATMERVYALRSGINDITDRMHKCLDVLEKYDYEIYELRGLRFMEMYQDIVRGVDTEIGTLEEAFSFCNALESATL